MSQAMKGDGMTRYGWSALIYVFMSLVSCGRDTHETNSGPASEPAGGGGLTESELRPEVLRGFWDGPCVASKMNKGLFDITRLHFGNDAVFHRERQVFVDATCQTSAGIETMNGSYDVSFAGRPNETVHNVMFKVIGMGFKTNSEVGATIFNKANACGFDKWYSGLTRNMAGIDCFGYTFSQGDRLMDILRVNLPRLYLGERVANDRGVYVWHARPAKIDEGVAYLRR